MKRFAVMMICLMTLALTAGCGNQDMWDTVYTYDEAICYGDFNGDGTAEWQTFEVDQWTDYGDGDCIQIETKEGDTYLFHSSCCILKQND